MWLNPEPTRIAPRARPTPEGTSTGSGCEDVDILFQGPLFSLWHLLWPIGRSHPVSSASTYWLPFTVGGLCDPRRGVCPGAKPSCEDVMGSIIPRSHREKLPDAWEQGAVPMGRPEAGAPRTLKAPRSAPSAEGMASAAALTAEFGGSGCWLLLSVPAGVLLCVSPLLSPFSSCLLPAFDSVTGSRSPSSASAVGRDACLLVSLSGPFVCRRQTPSVRASRGAHHAELCGWFGFPTRPVQPRGTDCPRLEPWD